MPFDLAETDRLLSTTRAVRKRLDLDRDVPDEILLDCIRLSQQAPTGSNVQGWRWMVVRDAGKRQALADLYRKAGADYLREGQKQAEASGHAQTSRVLSSANYLVEHLHEVPVHVIPCLKGRIGKEIPSSMAAGYWGSIFPAVWSFQLALRARPRLRDHHAPPRLRVRSRRASRHSGAGHPVLLASRGLHDWRRIQARRTPPARAHHPLRYLEVVMLVGGAPPVRHRTLSTRSIEGDSTEPPCI